MAYLSAFQSAVIVLFAGWTLAYHLVLASELPAAATPVAWLPLTPPLLAVVGWRRLRTLFRGRPGATLRSGGLARHRTAERRFALAVLLIGAAVGSALLFVGNANPDDYNFFHRALAQLGHLESGFFRHETGLTPSGLPQLSALHVMTAYEPLVALAAHAAGVDPLWAYQNGCTFAGALLMVVGFAALYRTLGVGAGLTLPATLAALAFMVLDLRPGRTYGSILPYIWTGKVLLWGVLLPWSITFTIRYLRRPLPGRLAGLMLTSVCATGLSGSGIFLFPVQVLAVSLGYLALQRPDARRLRRVVAANAASAYCAALAALALSGALPKPTDVSVWIAGWPQQWWSNLGLVFSTPEVLIRDLSAVLLLPLVALYPPWGRFMLGFGAAFLLIVANPLAGRIWMDIVTPGAYWRFAFLLPLAWTAGLVVVALARPAVPQRRPATLGIAALYLVSLAVSARTALLDPTSNLRALRFKPASASRLPEPELALARLASPLLGDRTVVCPERACLALALTDPCIRFEAVRGTPHIWANAGDADEGARRAAAQAAVSNGNAASLPALSQSLDAGADALVLVNTQHVKGQVWALLRERAGETWTLAVEHPAYVPPPPNLLPRINLDAQGGLDFLSVAEREHGAIARAVAGVQDRRHFTPGQQGRDALGALGQRHLQVDRRPLQHLQVKEPDAVVGQPNARRGEPALHRQVLEIARKIGLAQGIGRTAGKACQAGDRGQIALMGSG